MSTPSDRFARTARPPSEQDLERSERIPVPHRAVPAGSKPPTTPPRPRALSKFDRRRNLVHVQNILEQHFRRREAS